MVGSDLALAPVRGRVAFLSELGGIRIPSANLRGGSLEIWDVEKKAGIKTSFRVLEGLSWFSDGKRLAYAKLIDANALPAPRGHTDSLDTSFPGWDRVPAVFVRDVDAETESFLCKRLPDCYSVLRRAHVSVSGRSDNKKKSEPSRLIQRKAEGTHHSRVIVSSRLRMTLAVAVIGSNLWSWQRAHPMVSPRKTMDVVSTRSTPFSTRYSSSSRVRPRISGQTI